MKYRKLNSDFSGAIKAGQAKGVAEITNALFNQGKDGNTSGAIFYLKNRAGWSDKQDVNVTGDPLVTKIEIEVIE